MNSVKNSSKNGSVNSSMNSGISSSGIAGGNAVARWLGASPLIAVTLYLAVTGGLLLMAGLSIADVIAHRQALAQTSDLLDQLRGRKGAAKNAAAALAQHPGTPFLEGPTVTVAGVPAITRRSLWRPSSSRRIPFFSASARSCFR